MTIAGKLRLGFGLFLLLFLLIGPLFIWQFRRIAADVHQITAVHAPLGAAAYEMEINMLGTGQAVWRYAVTGDPTARQRVDKDAADFAHFKAQYTRLATTPQEQAWGERVGLLYQEFRTLGDSLMQQRDLQQSPSLAALQRFVALRRELDDLLDDAIQVQTRQAEAAAIADAEQTLQQLSGELFVLFVFTLLFGGGTAVLISRRITSAVQALTAGAEQFARGALDHRILLTPQDELGSVASVFNDMAAKRQQAEAALHTLNTELEQRVQERTAALQRATAAERTQREYFQTTLASIGDAVIVTDPQGAVTFLNRVAEEMTGWTTVDAVGKPLLEVFRIEHEGTRQPAENPVTKVLREGGVVGLAKHTVLIRRDGGICPIADSAAPILDEHGSVLGVILVFRDITARKQAEDALRKSEQRWHTLAETLPALVWMARPDGFLDYCNQRWYDYTGLTPEQLTGWGWEAVWHPEDLSEGRDRWLESLRTGQPYEHEARLRRADDSYCWHLNRGVPLRDQEGRVLWWMGTNTNTEEQKHMAVELQRVNEELQQFAYIVSHDLKEPLRNIAQLVTFLAEDYQDQLDAQAHEYITRTVAATQRLQQMLKDLLAYTQVGGRDFAFGSVDCQALLTTVLEDLEVTIAERDATITHDPLPTIVGDGTHLGQVFQNLIGNALKFCGKEPPRIHVSAQRDGGHWRFSVRDNGIGIDTQQARRLFQVFQRLHPRTEYPGTGIGLAICKKIVERHGGRIWVESAPGQGATFFFTLRDFSGETRK